LSSFSTKFLWYYHASQALRLSTTSISAKAFDGVTFRRME
jgi:hypothetical protein